ncbi:MAG: ERAP1-like C-terminal domain-containing protein, partial [Actinomycetes bacterium]
DLTYAKVRLDPRSVATMVDALPQLPSALSRAVLWGIAWNLCRDAEHPAATYVQLLLSGLGAESDLHALGALLAQGWKATNDYSTLAERDRVQAVWNEGVAGLLAVAEPGSDHQLALAKALPVATTPAGANTLAGWRNGEGLPEGLSLDPELRWSVVHHLARLGRLGEAEIAAEQAADPTITGAEQAAGARAARPTAEAKVEAWRLAVETDEIPNATQRAICRSFWARNQDAVLAPYVERYFAAAEDISAARGVWADKGMALRSNVLGDLFPQPRDLAAFLPRLDAWLEQAELGDSVRRQVVERRDDAVRALRCQQAASPAAAR